MRKAQDDTMARSAAEAQMADLIGGAPAATYSDHETAQRDAEFVVSAFKAVEFETTTRKVGDDEIHLRRLVITGPWEVDPGRH